MAFSGRPYSSSVGFIPKFGPFNLLNSLSCNPLVIGLVCISVLLLNTSVANAYTSLHPLEYKRLLSISKVHELLDPFNKDGLLEPILQERVPDTDGSRNVQNTLDPSFNNKTMIWLVSSGHQVATSTGLLKLIPSKTIPFSEKCHLHQPHIYKKPSRRSSWIYGLLDSRRPLRFENRTQRFH